MGKEFARRRVATSETATQAGVLSDFRSVRSAPASGVRGGRDHGRERRARLSGQASSRGANQKRDQDDRRYRSMNLQSVGPGFIGGWCPAKPANLPGLER